LVPAVEASCYLLLSHIRASDCEWVETARVTGPEQSWSATGLENASATAATFLAKVSPPPQVVIG
jgi:hypothetical protein